MQYLCDNGWIEDVLENGLVGEAVEWLARSPDLTPLTSSYEADNYIELVVETMSNTKEKLECNMSPKYTFYILIWISFLLTLERTNQKGFAHTIPTPHFNLQKPLTLKNCNNRGGSDDDDNDDDDDYDDDDDDDDDDKTTRTKMVIILQMILVPHQTLIYNSE
ncbi:hypothetical protein ANN_01325 [Periplaneta americana]|uniref:Uncharacterized protein n=1 Tax=Periplaneta americana TaxID=6978 RepID=A0ABQ8TUB9_PERAM|nr:hypothetical protein ANN_01325 [Periplaneta americana]